MDIYRVTHKVWDFNDDQKSMKYNDYKVKLTVLHEKKLNLLNDLAAKKKQVSSCRESTLCVK